MIEIQIKNLLLFHVMTNGIITGCDITNHSPDYLLELFNRYIGIEISNNKKYPDLQKDEIFIKYKKIWGRHCKFGDIPDCLYWFVVSTHISKRIPKTSTSVVGSRIYNLIEIFEDNIEKLTDINKESKHHTHPNLIKEVDSILSRLNREEIRDIKLRYMLS